MSLTIWKFVLTQFSLSIYGSPSVPICAYESFLSINRWRKLRFIPFLSSLGASQLALIKSVFAEVIMNNVSLKLQSEIRGLYVGFLSKAWPWWFSLVSIFSVFPYFQWANSLSEQLLLYYLTHPFLGPSMTAEYTHPPGSMRHASTTSSWIFVLTMLLTATIF